MTSTPALRTLCRCLLGLAVSAVCACSSAPQQRVRGSVTTPLDASTPAIEVLDNPRDGAIVSYDAGNPRDAGRDSSAPARDAAMIGCGDGKLQAGEACDDGNSAPGDGCSADCRQKELDFVCPAPGAPCVSSVVCGDGRSAGSEQCDDANARSGDGCDAKCRLEPGFVCPQLGAACVAAKCGDGILAGSEQCDDANSEPENGDGCSADCKLESGYVCPKPGASCVRTVCNDGIKQGSEACDDGNLAFRDGCTPFCEVEPHCEADGCMSRCGDGLILANDREACDDGNTRDGDGCSASCQVEAGYECMLELASLPDSLQVPITYRDFIALPADASVMRHPDFNSYFGGDVVTGLVANQLGMDGKPVYTGICDDLGQPFPNPNVPCPSDQLTSTKANFDQWYRSVPNVNVTKVERLALPRTAGSRSYSVAYPEFFPWDHDPNSWVGLGKELEADGHNFAFTSEVLYYFQYMPDPQTPQTLTFAGDDDVWVFINRRLAVDIGGVHSEATRSVTLDAATAAQLGIEAGRIYEIALFHAERQEASSHFTLTLDGFTSSTSRCRTRCGDGIVTGSEQCDDGKNDGSYAACTAQCRRAGHCGDGKLEAGREDCDDGVNITTYNTGGKPGCAPGCKRSAYCGDKQIDSVAGEECDDGENKGGYRGCTAECRLGPRCGDAKRQSEYGEECDDGNLIGGDGCGATCRIETPL